MVEFRINTNIVIMFLLVMCVAAVAVAHPDDEFCSDNFMDLSVCAELAALDGGEAPRVITESAVSDRSSMAVFLAYVALGIDHIIPDGFDHLLFLLAVVLATRCFRQLFIYISLFTLAHTVTLFLVALGFVKLPGEIVEVLIPLSIAIVAVENLFIKRVLPWRTALIFVFGLLHGMGFAGAFSEAGLKGDGLIWSLLGFNVGVELAQLVFALLVFLLAYFCRKSLVNKFDMLGSALNVVIVLVALFWAIERAMPLM